MGGVRAAELAVERAGEHGVACVVTRRCAHAGRLGSFTQQIAEAGLIGLGVCSSPIHGHWVAPFGGREGRLATNPFSFASPSSGDPIVLDMSTSAISEGNVRMCLKRGEHVPAGTIADSNGRTSTVPQDFYGPPMGTILPFGGPAGYKGTGLAIMVEILGNALAGNLIDDRTVIGNGVSLVAIAPGDFLEARRFRELIDGLKAYIRSSPPAEGCDRVVVPGELDFDRKRRLLVEGIEIEEAVWSEILHAADQLGIHVEAG
jgi:uncharacterized oxidoreductase